MKKYLLTLSIIGCLTLGIFITKPLMLMAHVLTPSKELAYTIHPLYMARDIKAYTQEATIIIIGEIAEVSAPYLRKDRGMTSQQDIKINVKEVLKGDSNIENIQILIQGGHAVIVSENSDISFALEENENVYQRGEKILIFVGKTTWNDYVPFAGPYGKYLIDEQENVSSIGSFRMTLKDLKAEIEKALKLPPKEQIVVPIEKMY